MAGLTWIELLALAGDILICLLQCIPIYIMVIIQKIFAGDGKKINGEVVLITGAGQGLGRELAKTFAREGCTVVCVDMNASTNNATVHMLKQAGRPAFGFTCDVSEKSNVVDLANRVLKDVGRVDILVNNAGILSCEMAPGANLSDKMMGLMKINAMAHLWTIQAFLPGMLERDHGHVVGISSMSGLMGLGSAVTYGASKGAVAGLMMCLSEELRTTGRKNIKTTIAYPYYITTPLIEEFCTIRAWAPMSVQYAASEIVKGVRLNVDSFVVPRFMDKAIYLSRLVPKPVNDKLRETFFTTTKIPPYELVSSEQYELPTKNK